VNTVFSEIVAKSMEAEGNEKGQTSIETDLSFMVAGTGLEPVAASWRI
jgi:hypothetical protein